MNQPFHWRNPLNSVMSGLAMLAMPACSSAPSRSILGSYFPSWMICAIVGFIAAIAARGILRIWGIDKELPVPVVVYLAILVAFTFATWLLWLG